MDGYDEFYDFMEQYTDFYYSVSENEKDKTDALASYNLEKINTILSDYQVFIMKVEQFEQKRNELQKKLGLEGKTFRAIVESENGECREELEDLFYSFRDAVMKTREYNRKSLEIVRENMRALGMLDYDGISDPACYNKEGTLPEMKLSGKSLFNREV